MNAIEPPRPRLSRETRLLLLTIVISLTTLSVLARIRFADQPVSPNPIAPVLTQLAPPPVFDQLSAAMLQIQNRTAPMLIDIEVTRAASRGQGPQTATALRLDEETAVAMLNGLIIREDSDVAPGFTVTAHDPASGLTVLRMVSGNAADGYVPPNASWSPRQPQASRYLIAAEVLSGTVSTRPIFVGPIEATTSRVWSDVVWALPASTDVRPQTFVFTTDGAFAGVISDIDGRLMLVPPETLRTAVDRLRSQAGRQYGQFGIDVQPLTPALASSTRAPLGVIVTWVDPGGPAAGQIEIGDVIVAIAGEPLSTFEHWRAVTARASVGETLSFRVQGSTGTDTRTVELKAAPMSAVAPPTSLGLTLRSVQQGSEVVRVARGSAGDLAGVQAGDVITLVGDRQEPAPADVRRAFNLATGDRPLLVAITRDEAHHVLAIEKR